MLIRMKKVEPREKGGHFVFQKLLGFFERLFQPQVEVEMQCSTRAGGTSEGEEKEKEAQPDSPQGDSKWEGCP